MKLKMAHTDRNDYYEAFGMRQTRRVNVLVPLHVTKKMELLYLFMYKNGMSYHFLIDLVMSFGLMTFYDLITEYKVTSFFQMLKLLKLMKKSMRGFVEAAKEVEPLITVSTFKTMLVMMKHKNMNVDDQLEFWNYLLYNQRVIVGEKIVLDTKDFETILNNWIIRKVKVKEI